MVMVVLGFGNGDMGNGKWETGQLLMIIMNLYI